ncbi:MAG: type III pantothenate kinase [Halioglobus sp.]|nr:type III pantothenate kinase [Halioglobus sp.]
MQLDVGNSRVKWRLVRRAEVLDRGTYSSAQRSLSQSLLNCAESVDQIWVSSVVTPEEEEERAALLRERWGIDPWFARAEARTGDLSNSYIDPSRMGADRWLAMLAARRRVAGRVCVVDAGSALTIDLVSALGEHEGGYILPGVGLMEQALLLDTDRVRFDSAADYALSPGTDTASAVRHGIALAEAGAVTTALAQAGEDTPALLFSGGGGERLMALLQMGGEWVPDLVFEGLELMATLR